MNTCECSSTTTNYYEEKDYFIVVVTCKDCGRIIEQWIEDKD